jgi:uncharacterized protein with HEPN domain
MKGENIPFVEEINQHCNYISSFVKDMTFNIFLHDIKTRQACVLSLIQIGENAKKLAKAFKETYSDVPWQKMSDVRNIIAHNYGGINWNTVWQIIEEGVPELADYTEKILSIECKKE